MTPTSVLLGVLGYAAASGRLSYARFAMAGAGDASRLFMLNVAP